MTLVYNKTFIMGASKDSKRFSGAPFFIRANGNTSPLDLANFFYYLITMFKFFLKKNFADVWDNLFHLIFINLILLVAAVLVALAVLGLNSIPVDVGKRNLILFVGILLLSGLYHVLVLAEGTNLEKVSNYGASKVGVYFSSIASSFKDGMLFGMLVGMFVIVALVSIPYYVRIWIPMDGSKGSLMGLFCMGLIVWIEIISILALQWFMPIRNLMHNNFLKCVKKSYIIFFDNVRFSIAVAFVNLLNILITIFTLGLIPGLSGMQLTLTNALRLRLYKYDWYEVNPGMSKEQRKDVPWEDLIAGDKQILGPRGWKSFIFPWKEN